MKVDVTTVGSFQKRLDFQVTPDAVAGRLDLAYKRLAGQVRLAGFRPGRAPRQVLEARYGGKIESDVANDLIQQSYQAAISDHGIEPVSQPNLAETGQVSDAGGFKFTITVDVRPEVALDRWTGLDVVYPAVEVSTEEVDKAVQNRLEGQGKLEEVTGRGAERGDLALVELVARDGDDEVAREVGTMIRTSDDPYYPGVEPLIDGLEIGAERTGTVAFSAEARTEAVAGRTLSTTIKLIGLQRHQAAELTDALATELGYEGGVAGMRSAVESQIRRARDEMARNQARANLLEALIAANKFDVPQGMVETSLKMLMEELRMQQAIRSGRDPRTIGFNDAQVRDLRVRSEFAAKAGLILEWVSKHEAIGVDEADLEKKYAELSDQRGQTIEAVKGWFTKEEAVGELKDRILEEKTLDWLLERANLVAAAAPVAEAAAPAKKKKKAEVEAQPAADAAPVEAATSPLDGKIDELKAALASGSLDGQLDSLLAAETGGRNRKGAVSAIEARKKEVDEG